MTALPSARDVEQLAALRAIRVRRARAACAEAQATVDAAREALIAQQTVVAGIRDRIEALERAVTGEFAAQMPRWSATVKAEQEYLADQLERAEYMLQGVESELESAEEALTQARVALSQAMAREDVVRGLVKDVQRAVAKVLDTRAEVELEDTGRRPSAAHA